MDADDLIASGYRATSNKYRHVSRIDREDWKEAMANFQTGGFPGDPKKNFEAGMKWVNALGDGAADFYRRVLSKDVLRGIDPDVFQKVRKAGSHGWGGVNEFKPLVGTAKNLLTN